MNKKRIIILAVVISLALLAGISWNYLGDRSSLEGNITNPPVKPTDQARESIDQLAKCLTEKGIIMYGRDSCPHCQEQKKIFGGSFSLVNYIDCVETPGKCPAEIKWIPAWVFPDKKIVYGAKTLEELNKLSGCPFKTEQ
jgi:hypothetical protein